MTGVESLAPPIAGALLPFVPLLSLKGSDDHMLMDTYSGNTNVEITFSGWLYLANLDIARARKTTNRLDAADLLARAKQKLALAAQPVELPKALR